MNQKNTNIKYISGVSQYLVNSDDEILNVDSTAMAITIILPNIRDWQLLFAKPKRVITINDAGGNAGTNAITVIANGNNINGEGSLLLDADKDTATFFPVDNNEWFGDKQPSGGGSMTTANNGLTVNAGIVQLGGSLILPTTITSSFANTFEVVDGFGSLIKSRDSDYNVSLFDYGGNTITNSQHITSYVSIGNTYTDSNIVLNFGSIGVYNLAVDVFNFGDYTTVTNSSVVYNFGRQNSVTSNSQGVSIFGNYNSISGSIDTLVIGSSNTISNKNNMFFIGNSDKYLSVNGSNGEVNVYAGNITLGAYTGLPAISAMYMGVTPAGSNYFLAKNGSAYFISGETTLSFAIAGSVYAILANDRFNINQNVGIGTGGVAPTSALNVIGQTILRGNDATGGNYALKVENSALATIFYVRNDGFVTINGTTIGAAKLEVTGGAYQGIYANSNSIGLNGSGSANGSIGVSAVVQTGFAGTSLYVRSNNSSNILIDIVNSSTNPISRMLDSGFFGLGNVAPSHLLSVYTTKTATSAGSTINAINLGGMYSNTAGQFPKVILYDDGGSIAGIGVSSGQIDYIGYSTSVNHVFWAGATKRVVLGGDGNNGFNKAVPTAAIHAQGLDATSSNYALKVENSATSLLFSVRNDGAVNFYAGGYLAAGIDSGSNFFSQNYTYLREGVVFGDEAAISTVVRMKPTWHMGLGTVNGGSKLNINGTNFTYALTVTDGKINFSGVPTSSAGLSAGDVWNDSGTLKLV